MVFQIFIQIFIFILNFILPGKRRHFEFQELERHRADGDLWVALYGQVYDLTELGIPGSLVGSP